MEVIKKYANRKLYSTKANGYVKLDYINELVKSGARFQIIDNNTKDDITNAVLKQSIGLLDLNNSVLKELIKG